MFITPAFAADAAAATATSGDAFASLAPIFLILGVFYFLILRPQNKRMQEHRAMVDNLSKGDKVVTGGGLLGTVKKAVEGETEITVEIAPGVEVQAVRSTVVAKKA